MQNEEKKQLNKELLYKMIECVKREVKYRYIVYPRLIAAGKMKQEEADEQKKLMYLVQICLQRIYDGEVAKGVQQSLFDTALYKPTDTSYLN